MHYRIAHISDVHLPPLPEPGIRGLMSKRIFGYLSWSRNRKYDHVHKVLSALKNDLEDVAADQICITGDLTNIALPAEFINVAAWLETLGLHREISLIPGNHDAYVRGALKQGLSSWIPWLGDQVDTGCYGAADFPVLWRRGPVDIIGVSTAVATPPLMASGRIGAGQLKRLRRRLNDAAEAGQTRVMLLHHPPDAGAEPWRKALRDAGALRALLRETGAELVLHGHSHTRRRTCLSGPDGEIPVLGAGSASAAGCRREPGHYHRLTLDTDDARAMLHIAHRVYDPDSGAYSDGGCETLSLPRR